MYSFNCYFCKNNVRNIHSSMYHCKTCNVSHCYYNSVLEYIEMSCGNYYIYLNLKYKWASLNEGLFNEICDLNFETSLNINPQNIKAKINTMLTYL